MIYMPLTELMLTLLAAVFLDIILSDREDWPHPVRWMGNAVSFFSSHARRMPFSPLIQGVFLTSFLVFLTWFIFYGFHVFFCFLSPFLCLVFGAVTVYFGISLRCLALEASSVLTALETDGVEAARIRLSRIVGRDTGQLEESEILMAAIETVAENFVDGVVSPFFYALILGPAGCMTYKMINTLDSMVGYKNSENILFGRFSARLDDAANYLPARLAVIAIWVGAFLSPAKAGKMQRSFDVLKGVIRDGGKHSSPNSGLPESAFAWYLGVRLGGPCLYDGVVSHHPFINEGGRVPLKEDLKKSIHLLYMSSITFFLLSLTLMLLMFLS